MNLQHYWDILLPYATHIALRILGAIILWIIGRWLIRFVDGMVRKALLNRHVDATVAKYTASALGIILTIALVVAILGYFGIQTTTFAAIALGSTAAIGLAWSGLLANFAAGIFLIVLRPYRVGDFVQIQDTMGTVEEIGLFFTAINTLNNDRIYHGNNKVLSGTIENYSTNPYRRVDCYCQLASDVDHQHAISLLQANLAKIPNVLQDPAPVIEILEFTEIGPKLAVFPFCNNAHYWQVYWNTNRIIRETMLQGGFPYALPKQVWVSAPQS
ncbi:MAG: mechanosensitive ion channel family protein [Candidatus Igneacidithiobacillus chanchocoensis]